MDGQCNLFEGGVLVDGRTAPFFWFPTELVDSGDLAKMKGPALLVLLVLTRHADDHTRTTRPSLARIAEKSGLSETTVRAAIQTLIGLGYLQVGPSDSGNESHPFVLTFPNGRQCETHSPRLNDIPKTAMKSAAKSGGDKSHQALIHYFGNKWQAAYGGKYPFQGGKDGDAMRAIRQHFDSDARRATVAIDAYFDDADPFVVQAKHPVALFRCRLHRYVATKVGPRGQRPEDDFNGAPLSEEERDALWGEGGDAENDGGGE